MTNEEQIYKLCEYVIDVIDALQGFDRNLNKNLEWIRDEIESIREDIDNKGVF